MSRRNASIALVACTWILLLVPSGEAAMYTVTTVRTGDSSAPFAFDPPSLTIQVGDSVRWVNEDGAYHTTTNRAREGGGNGDLWEGILRNEGASFEFVFTEPGTYAYFCQPHASFMEGVVVVGDGEGSPGDGEGDRDSPGLGPAGVLLVVLMGLLVVRRVRRL